MRLIIGHRRVLTFSIKCRRPYHTAAGAILYSDWRFNLDLAKLYVQLPLLDAEVLYIFLEKLVVFIFRVDHHHHLAYFLKQLIVFKTVRQIIHDDV